MNTRQHFCKALHNEEFWRKLYSEGFQYSDWIVVGIFYSALHYIDAFFGRSNIHLKDHERADKEISGDRNMASIYSEYRALKDYRWKASYRDRRFGKDEIDKDIIPNFEKIKTFVRRMLGSGAP